MPPRSYRTARTGGRSRRGTAGGARPRSATGTRSQSRSSHSCASSAVAKNGACEKRSSSRVAVEPDRTQERVRLVRLLRREVDPAAVLRAEAERVTARGHAAAGRGVRSVASARGSGACGELHVVDAEVVGRDHALHERRVDTLAATGGLARDQRGEDPAHRHVRGTGARRGRAREDRAVAEAEHAAAERADLRLDDAFVRLELRVRPGRTETGDRAVHETGVGHLQ